MSGNERKKGFFFQSNTKMTKQARDLAVARRVSSTKASTKEPTHKVFSSKLRLWTSIASATPQICFSTEQWNPNYRERKWERQETRSVCRKLGLVTLGFWDSNWCRKGELLVPTSSWETFKFKQIHDMKRDSLGYKK